MSLSPISQRPSHARSFALAVVMLLSFSLCACEKAQPKKYVSEADHIFIAFGSVWRNGYEVELPKSGVGGSIFKQTDIENVAENIGQRADLKDTKRLFVHFSDALKTLESRSTLKEDIGKTADMGFGCEDSLADSTMLQVIWFYPQKPPRYAAFYTGCMNDFTETQWPAISELGYSLERSIPASAWKSSKARFVDLGKWR